MTTKRIQLQPGIWLNYVHTDRFKTGCFSMNMVQPLTEVQAAPNALLPSVLLRGCRAYPDMQSISRRLDHLYGGSVGSLVRKKGENQTIGLYADFLEDCYAEQEPLFARMLDFVRQLVFEPCLAEGGFVPAYVAGEKQNLINAMDARLNDKRAYAVSRLLHHMCTGETYAVPRLGKKETLQQVSGEMLYGSWQQILAASPMELFYLGKQEEGRVLETMQTLLQALPARAVAPICQTQVVLPNRPVQTVEEAMDVTQGKLTIGLRTPITVHDPRYPALVMMSAVYGSGMTSKLFLKIREEQSLCYYANSCFDKFKGIMVIDSGVEFENYEKARDGILEQLECVKRGELTEEEIESARSYLISGLRTGKDSPGRLDDFAIGQAVAGLQGTMEDLAEQLRQVTREQIVEAANTLVLDTIYFLKGVEA